MSITNERSTRSRARTARTGSSEAQSQPSVSELAQTGTLDPEDPNEPPPGSNRPEEVRNTPNQSDLHVQLVELREWRQRILEEQELARLRDIKRRVEQGDLTALQEDFQVTLRPTEQYIAPNAGAPPPDRPTRFNNRDRAEYNRWERECEATFRGNARIFSSDTIKIDFGLRFISNPLKTTWDTYVHDNQRKNPHWHPTWSHLKANMLDALGPAEQRKLAAHKDLKGIKQEWSQDPNDLLSTLDTLWTELGPSYPEEQRVMDFMGALVPTVQKELLLIDPSLRSTVSDLNSRARLIWDRNRRDKPSSTKPKGKKQNREKSPTDEEGGTKKTWKKPKRNTAEQKGPNQPKTGQYKGSSPGPVCYRCGLPGHKQKDCTQPEATATVPTEAKSGKGKGRKA